MPQLGDTDVVGRGHLDGGCLLYWVHEKCIDTPFLQLVNKGWFYERISVHCILRLSSICLVLLGLGLGLGLEGVSCTLSPFPRTRNWWKMLHWEIWPTRRQLSWSYWILVSYADTWTNSLCENHVFLQACANEYFQWYVDRNFLVLTFVVGSAGVTSDWDQCKSATHNSSGDDVHSCSNCSCCLYIHINLCKLTSLWAISGNQIWGECIWYISSAQAKMVYTWSNWAIIVKLAFPCVTWTRWSTMLVFLFF